jgi:hypothetical protein
MHSTIGHLAVVCQSDRLQQGEGNITGDVVMPVAEAAVVVVDC